MMYYMVEIALPEAPDAQFFHLIPDQKAHVDQLMEEGTIRQYALSHDRTRLWVVTLASDEQEVWEILATFPMITYMKPALTPLMFADSVASLLPSFSLN
jgi:muconolactone delta-isomerase